jgi:hypothetical protein
MKLDLARLLSGGILQRGPCQSYLFLLEEFPFAEFVKSGAGSFSKTNPHADYILLFKKSKLLTSSSVDILE